LIRFALEAIIEPASDKGLVHWVDADKDDFLPAVAPDWADTASYSLSNHRRPASDLLERRTTRDPVSRF
jgi:hypothetical protein